MKKATYLSVKHLILLSLLMLCSGCQSVNMNGHYIDNEIMALIKDKKASKEQVLEAAGTPEVISSESPNKWYYIERRTTANMWSSPKVIEQKIAEVIFDGNNQVVAVNIMQDTNLNNITNVKDYTITSGTKSNIMQAYVRNIGKFNNNKKRIRNKEK